MFYKNSRKKLLFSIIFLLALSQIFAGKCKFLESRKISDDGNLIINMKVYYPKSESALMYQDLINLLMQDVFTNFSEMTDGTEKISLYFTEIFLDNGDIYRLNFAYIAPSHGEIRAYKQDFEGTSSEQLCFIDATAYETYDSYWDKYQELCNEYLSLYE